MSEREYLKPSTELMIKSGESDLKIRIIEVIGEGNCCIAYKAEMLFQYPYTVVLKECYPRKLDIIRSAQNGELVPDDSLSETEKKRTIMQLEDYKESFKKGNISQAAASFKKQEKGLFTPGIGEPNKILYDILELKNGLILSDYCKNRKLTIKEIANICISLCESIQDLNMARYLYLDCKPDNIFINNEKEAYVIDFDTCEKMGALDNHAYVTGRSKFSNGWAAPEQLVIGSEIDFKTDVFSIGAVFFWLITGGKKTYSISEKDTENGLLDLSRIDYQILDDIKEDKYDWWNNIGFAKEDVYDGIIDIIKKIAQGSLARNKEDRKYSHAGKMIADFKELLSLSDISFEKDLQRESNNKFEYFSNSTMFFGREKEIRFLRKMCDADKKILLAGICGLGGCGKSRLAYEFCMQMKEEHWIVFTPASFSSKIDEIESAIKKRAGNVLICFDYIKCDLNDIVHFIKKIKENIIDSNYKYKIRILLLERNSEDISELLDEVNEDNAFDDEVNEDNAFDDEVNEDNAFDEEENVYDEQRCKEIIDLTSMDDEELLKIICDYIIKQGGSLFSLNNDSQKILDSVKSIDPENNRPLYALFIAEAWINHSDLSAWNTQDALEYLRKKERARLVQLIRVKTGATGKDLESKLDGLLFIYALATYLGEISLEDCEDVLKKYRLSKNDACDILNDYGVLRDYNIVVGWKPDLIGEYFCIEFLKECTEEESRYFFEIILHSDLKSFSKYSDMIFSDAKSFYHNENWYKEKRNNWIKYIQEINIPDKYVIIDANLFRANQFLKKVTFSERTIEIRVGAFRDCRFLETVLLPSTLEIIGLRSFEGCSNLTNIEMLNKTDICSIRNIGKNAFKDCIQLESFPFSESLERIGLSAFFNCKRLESFEFPSCKIVIDNKAFECCDSLNALFIHDSNEAFDIPVECFMDCSNLRIIEGSNRISSIRKDAFRNCISLEKINLSSRLCDLRDTVFVNCESLQSVNMGESQINKIFNNTFRDCESLSSVLLPESIVEIEIRAFEGCSSLQSLPAMNNLEKIGDDVFKNCASLERVDFSKGKLQEIGENAFENCNSLEYISFGNSIRKVGLNAFRGCSKLSYENVKELKEHVCEAQKDFCGFEFIDIGESEFNFLISYSTQGKVTIPNNVVEIKDNAFRENSEVNEVVIPSSVNNIGKNAFWRCENLKSVECENNKIASIGANAFAECPKLEKINGKLDIEKVEDGTFSHCELLETIEFTDRLKNVGRRAFFGCSSLKTPLVASDWIPLVIGTSAFEGCNETVNPINDYNIKRLNIHPTQYNIEGFIFKEIGKDEISFLNKYFSDIEVRIPFTCVGIEGVNFNHAVEFVRIPKSIKHIPDGLFKDYKKLRTVNIASPLTNLPKETFKGCKSLKTILFGKKMRNEFPEDFIIGERAFEGCKALRSIVIPKKTKEIKKNSFCNCSNLKTITIPSNVEVIEDCAFSACEKLEELEIEENSALRNLGKGVFKKCSALGVVRGLDETQIHDIPDETFEGCSLLKKISLPSSIKSIGKKAFMDCHVLGIEKPLPKGLESISDYAFYNCYSIESIVLPLGIKDIPKHAFENCSSLSSCILPNEIKLIDDYAFYNCQKLQSNEDDIWKLPRRLEQIGNYAFSYCSNLEIVVLPEKITQIPSGAFEGCRGLTTIKSLSSINEIGSFAFRNCINLKNVFSFDNVKEIGENAFSNSYLLESGMMNFSNKLLKIGKAAFKGCVSIENMCFPASLAELESELCYGCNNLRTITFEGNINIVESNAFGNCVSLEEFPFERVIEEIGKGAFYNCKEINKINLSDSICEIGSSCFNGCSSASEVNIPLSLSVINSQAFRGLDSLSNIKIPSDVKKICNSAFRSCKRLNTVEIESDILEIDEYSFSDCEKLYYIVPRSDQYEWTINKKAFEGCPALNYLDQNESVTFI